MYTRIIYKFMYMYWSMYMYTYNVYVVYIVTGWVSYVVSCAERDIYTVCTCYSSGDK